MSQPLFKGVITALATPFRDGALDVKAFAALVERQVAAGVDGVVPVGTTGESAVLSHAEHERVIELCLEVVNGRCKVLAGAGSNATDEAISLARHAKRVGADGALVITPYYNRPSQEGLFRHFSAIADAVDLPIVLYNVPARTGVDLSNDTVARLARHSHIIGIKDATGDLARASLMRRLVGDDFALISGDDPTFLGHYAHGGCGVISVTSNVAPEACVAQWGALKGGDYVGALAWQDRLIHLHKALFLDASPAPVKYALARLGLCGEELRLPLVPCADRVKPEIDAAMREAGLL
jgi:4-hydroxy-tetrahydrodipicolinate synthase